MIRKNKMTTKKQTAMRKIALLLTILAMAFFILGGMAAAAANADANLAGLWGMTGTGVGYSGGTGDVFLLWLGKDGKAAVTSVQGCIPVSWPAVWESEGNTLRLVPEREDAQGAFWKGTYEYSAGINILVLRKKSDDKSMVLTRRKNSPLMTIPLT